MKVKEMFRRGLACLLIAAMMPQQTIAFAAEQASSARNKKEDVLVRWIPGETVIEPGEKGTIKLEARINKKNVEHAEVSIHLDPSEVFALCDEKLEDDSRIGIDWLDDGGADLYFELDEDTPRLSRKIYFQMPTDSIFDIDVTPEDIDVVAYGPEESDDEDAASPSDAAKAAASPSEIIEYSETAEEIAATSSEASKSETIKSETTKSEATGSAATSSEADKVEIDKDSDDENAATESNIGDSKHVKITTEGGFVIRRETQALRVKGIRPEWKMNVKAKSGSSTSKDTLDFALTASPKNRRSSKSLADKEQTLTLTVTVPEWLNIRSGEVTWNQEDEQLLVDGTTIATLKGIPEEFVLTDAEISDEHTITASFERIQGEEDIVTILENEEYEEANGPAVVMLDADDVEIEDTDTSIAPDADEVEIKDTDTSIVPVAELSKLNISLSLYKSAPIFEISDDFDLTGTDDETYGTVLLEANLVTTSAGLSDTVSADANSEIAFADYVENDKETIKVDKTTDLTENIYWIDNGNASKIRPDSNSDSGYLSVCKPVIYFTEDESSEKIALTEENWKKYFYPDDSGDEGGSATKAVPSPVYNGGTTGTSASLKLSGLPTQTTATNADGTTEGHTYNWTIELTNFGEKENSGNYTSKYSMLHVTDDNSSEYQSASATGWYYVEREKLNFNIDVKAGDKSIDAEKLLNAIKSTFDFQLNYNGGNTSEKTFDEISGKQTATYDSDKKIYNFNIEGLWKYNLDGTSITYILQEKTDGGAVSGKIEGTVLDGAIKDIDNDDYLKISYDNSSVPNYGSVITKLHNGGTLDLTLKGSTEYEASKVWADKADPGKRPTGTFELWRYRKGQSYTDAAPVRDAKGFIVSKQIGQDAVDSGNEVAYQETISFGNNNNDTDSLEKYDPEGYEYVYVTREYLDSTTNDGSTRANSYEQIYGEITADASSGKESIRDVVEDTSVKRDYLTGRGDSSSSYESGTTHSETKAYVSGNDWVYNGGTLTNRLKDQITVEGVKHWQAKAFQDDLKNVTATMTLYSKKADDSDSGWTEVKNVNPVVLTGFQNETIENNSFSVTVPQYDSEGNQLLYRWIETGVTQTDKNGNTVDTKFTRSKEQGSGFLANLLGTGDKITDVDQRAVFELEHIGETNAVPYESTSNYDAATGVSSISNAIEDTVTFTLKKTWDEGMTTYPVQFSLYRTTGSGDGQKLGTFSLDGKSDSKSTWTPEENVADSAIITGSETEEWTTVLNNLPKYDSSGRLYQYYVTEAKNEESSEFITPTYETSCDESGNWLTNVHNGNGNGQYIWIRKDWLDDGDSAHREPVTVGIYRKVESSTGDSYKKLTSAGVNGNVTLSVGNAWYVRVGIGDVNPSNIYVVEEKVGNNNILTVNDTTNVADIVSNGHEYQTGYHHYKVTYKKEVSDSNEPVFAVQNRRIGTIDYTVTKQWKDGDGSRRAALKKAVDAINGADADGNKKIDLIVRLKFQSNYDSTDADDQEYAISKDGTAETGDTVTVNQDGATPIYKIKNSDGSYHENGKSWYSVLDGMNSDLDSSSDSGLDSSLDSSTNNTEEFYFFNLPKYDYSGANVAYTVEELWIDGSGNKVTDLSGYQANVDGQTVQLSDLWADYSMSLSGASYDIGECYTGDTQKITMTNRLSGTKDLLWHKQWQDDYNYTSGQRPDIYLSIYCGRADKDNDIKEYSTQYRWTTPSNEAADDDEMSKLHHWHAVVSGVPKYDEDGYELKYFALENTKVNKDNFDYEVAKYSLAGEESSGSDVNSGTITGSSQTGQVIGTEDAISDETLSSYVRNASSLTGSSSPKYALAEGGTITNRIKNEVTIKGRKLWKNLPDNFWKDEKNIDSLPSVKLHVKRKLANASEETPATEVASLTIKNTDWKYLGSDGSYEFTLEREGNYEYEFDTTSGTLVLKLVSDNVNTDVTTKEPLQRYNERGVLYKYSITEDMSWGDDVSVEERATNLGDVYKSSVSAYVLTNNYDSVKGALKVKKLLELPVNTTNFPAIKMELTRTFEAKNNSGVYIESADDSFKKTQVWSAEDVKKAFDAAVKTATAEGENAATSVLLDSTSVSGSTKDPFLFENLDKYAPNGIPYKYYVKEIKEGYLNGYDTWVQTGDVNTSVENAISGLKTEINKNSADGNVVVTLTENQDAGHGDTAENLIACATYLNIPNATPEKIKIDGQKIWTRYSFENPPSTDEFSRWLTLWRSADSQPGQNNAIKSQKVENVKFKSVSTGNPVGESGVLTTTYHYGVYNLDTATDIESDPSTDSYAELDRYAPNGMPWKYVVRETIPNGSNSDTNWMQYFSPTGDSSRNVVEVKEKNTATEDGNVVTMAELKNSGLTSVSYSKSWVDQDGNPITADYTGLGTLKVNFELQVKEGTSGQWQNAAEYFKDNNTLGDSAKISDLSISGTILSPVWGKSQKIDNLPRFVYNITSATSGEYIPLSYRVVEKSVSIVSASGVENTIVSWNVTDRTDGKGYTLTSNSDSTGSDISSASADSKAEEMIDPYYGKGSSGAALSYHSNDNNDHTNKLKLHTLTIKKKWENDRNNLWRSRPASSVSGKDWSAWFLVQRREKGTQSAENEGWENVKEYNSDGSEKGDRIITVSGKNSDNEVSTKVTGLLETAPSGNAYEYRFVELADSSANTENVTESTASTGYSVTIEAGTGADAATFTATNKLETTQVQAGKKWVNKDTCGSVSLHLTYKGTDEEYHEVKNSTVTLDGKKDTNPASASNAGSKNNTAFGYEDESWHARWILPKKITSDMRSDQTEPYNDDNGNTIYAVEEINNDGTGNTGYYQLGDLVVDSTGETTITNMKLVKLNLSKIWRANEDAKKEVEITIYRIAGVNAVPDDDSSAEEIGTVALNASNNWSFSSYYLDSSSGVGAENRVYFDKYKVNSDGSADEYLYYAREVSVDGTDVGKDGKVSTSDGERYEVNTQTVAFTVATTAGAASSATVEERRAVFTNFQLHDIEVRKIWNDNKNAYNTRPESLTVRLWRTTGTVKTDNNGSLTTTGNWVQVGDDVELKKLNESEQNPDTWVYTWKDLPYYDENGSLYTYKVEEVVPTVNEKAESHASEAVYECGGISGNGKNTAAVETKNTGTNEGKAELKNTLTRQISVSGIKYWADGNNLRPDDITLTLKRTTEDNVTADSWTDIAYTKSDDSFLSSVADAVRTLFAGSSSSDSGPELKWTKDGNQWAYTFSKLEGYDSDGKRYVYKVDETVPDGYRNVILGDLDDSGLPDLVNIRQTNVSIKKKWYKTDDVTPESVKIKIYRTTDDEVPADASLDGNGTSEYLGDVELDQMNNFKWSGSSLEATTADGASTTTYFDSYKIYDSDGKPVTKPQKYLYYAREYQVKASDEADNISVTTSSDGYITVNSELFEISETVRYSLTATSGQLDDSMAVIINRQTTDLELTKTWLDDGNAYKTRPESLSVSLSRFVEDGETEKLSDLSAVVKKNGNKWTFTWKNMPMYDMDGNRYTYVVREAVPEAQADSLLPGSSYICLEADQKAVFDNDGKASLTNLLKKETDLAGQKTWSDGDGTSRPDKIELKLYRRLSGKTDWEEIAGAKPTWYKQSDGTWNFIYANILQTNENGIRYYYKVEEIVPDGYRVYYSKDDDGNELTLKNVANGSLTVSKEVKGSGASKLKEFHFTIEVGKLPDGSKLPDGTYGDIIFTDSKAEITLKGGESLEASGLPGDITYVVYETEADKGGYVTTSENSEGSILPAGALDAHFINSKRGGGSSGGSSGGSGSEKNPNGNKPTGPALDSLTPTEAVTPTEPVIPTEPVEPVTPAPETNMSGGRDSSILEDPGRVAPANRDRLKNGEDGYIDEYGNVYGKNRNPKTGDCADLIRDVLEMFVAGAAVLFLLFYRKKKKKEE